MNIHSAYENIMFAPAELLCDWQEQWPSNYGDLDLSVMEGGVGPACGPASDFIFIPWYVIVVGCIVSGSVLRSGGIMMLSQL
jgi:hypothetical protein